MIQDFGRDCCPYVLFRFIEATLEQNVINTLEVFLRKSQFCVSSYRSYLKKFELLKKIKKLCRNMAKIRSLQNRLTRLSCTDDRQSFQEPPSLNMRSQLGESAGNSNSPFVYHHITFPILLYMI